MEKISDISTNAPPNFDKAKAKKHLAQLQEQLPDLQNLFYAEGKYALLQDKRLEERLTNPKKKWKYNDEDKKEARKWDDYMTAYQNVLDGCQKNNPWIVVPADDKWYRNYVVANTIVETLENLKMQYPH